MAKKSKPSSNFDEDVKELSSYGTDQQLTNHAFLETLARVLDKLGETQDWLAKEVKKNSEAISAQAQLRPLPSKPQPDPKAVKKAETPFADALRALNQVSVQSNLPPTIDPPEGPINTPAISNPDLKARLTALEGMNERNAERTVNAFKLAFDLSEHQKKQCDAALKHIAMEVH